MGRHVAKAEKERGRCEDTLARWQAESAAKRAELADLESRLGAMCSPTSQQPSG